MEETSEYYEEDFDEEKKNVSTVLSEDQEMNYEDSNLQSIENLDEISQIQELEITDHLISHNESKEPVKTMPRQSPKSSIVQSKWRFTIIAHRLRSMHLPTNFNSHKHSSRRSVRHAPNRYIPDIKEIRIHAVIDKQSQQSIGSTWTKLTARISPMTLNLSANDSYRLSKRSAYWKNDNGKLQWSFSMEKFRHLKGYSPRVKVLVIGLPNLESAPKLYDPDLSKKYQGDNEIICLGWFFLDLRTPDLSNKWLKLQNSPYEGEIQVSTNLTATPVNELNTNKVADDHFGDHQSISASKYSESTPFSCLPVGKRNGSDVFVITMFLKSARNLSSLCSTANIEELVSGYWLAYSLFDVIVQTDVFKSLEAPILFPAIRDSFRIRSCIEDVSELLHEMKSINVYLCAENQIIDFASVEILELLGNEMFTRPSECYTTSLDGEFYFSRPPAIRSNPASIVVSLSIEKIQMPEEHNAKNSNSINTTIKIGDAMTINSALERKLLCTKPEVLDNKAKDEAQKVALVDNIDLPKVDMASVWHMNLGVLFAQIKTNVLDWEDNTSNVVVEVQINDEKREEAMHDSAYTQNDILCDTFQRLSKIHKVCTSDDPPLDIEIKYLNAKQGLIASAKTHWDISNHSDKTSTNTTHLDFPMKNPSNEVVGCCRLAIHFECTSSSSSQNKDKLSMELQDPETTEVKTLYRLGFTISSAERFNCSGHIIMKYSNPFSGQGMLQTRAIALNYPKALEDPKHGKSFGVFNIFTMSESSLRTLLENTTLSLDAYLEVDGTTHFLGVALLSFGFIYYSPKSMNGLDKSCSLAIPVLSSPHTSEGSKIEITQAKHLGKLQVFAHLQYVGPISPISIGTSQLKYPSFLQFIENSVKGYLEESGQDPILEKEYQQKKRALLNESYPADRDTNLNVHELKEALLEEQRQWKLKQLDENFSWKKKIKSLEEERMKALEQEWSKHEHERSNLVRHSQKEYESLVAKLQSSLLELETRERAVARAEEEAQHTSKIQSEEFTIKMKRLEMDHAHAKALAKATIEDLQRHNQTLQQQLKRTESRLKSAESDFQAYIIQQRQVDLNAQQSFTRSAEAKLREELLTLKCAINELQKSKTQTELELAKANDDVEKWKKTSENLGRQLRREKKKHELQRIEEIEKLRLQYLAREERYVLDGDRIELQAIKSQLRSLQSFASNSKHDIPSDKIKVNHPRNLFDTTLAPNTDTEMSHPVEQTRVNLDSLKSSSINSKYINNNSPPEVKRLMKEKQLLLSSGAYDQDSFLVKEIDQLIQFAKKSI